MLHLNAKLLPPPARDDDLPLPPPSILAERPRPPPSPSYNNFQHFTSPDGYDRHSPDMTPNAMPGSRSPLHLNLSQESRQFADTSELPVTPISPLPPTPMSAAPPDSPSAETKPKKANPLVDLIDTEKLYVDQLTGIIRKVASAWSRSNMPPHDLDIMFRGIEGLYKTNRAFLSKLKDLGSNPPSPKALGDLLMRWIDDLDGPYTTYCTKYLTGFDTWDEVQRNANLLTILASFSASSPPPLAPFSPEHPPEPPLWTLDSLFLLPRGRLKYYKKLYGRLLKGTSPGRSDHRLLTGAIEKLDRLIATLDERGDIQAGISELLAPLPSPPVIETQDEVVIDMGNIATNVRDPVLEQEQDERLRNGPQPTLVSQARASGSSSARASSVSSGERLSRETASTSVARGSSATLSSPITDLERRLSTARTLDIFSMKPKDVRLQMSPASLPFTRELRLSLDVVIYFTPRSTGVPVVHRRGHIYLLTDLFLVCESMTPEERADQVPDGPDMWLCYPPLAGKHLRVSLVDDTDTALQVVIMKREMLILHTESVQLRDQMMVELKECTESGGLVSSNSKQPPPPVPSLNSIPRSISAPLPTDSRPPSLSTMPGFPRTNGTFSPRSSSPGMPSRRISPSVSDRDDLHHHLRSPPLGPDVAQGMSRMVLAPDTPMQSVMHRIPSIHDHPPHDSRIAPRTSSTAETIHPGPTFGPVGQVFPPPRGGNVPSGPANGFQPRPPPQGHMGQYGPPPSPFSHPPQMTQQQPQPFPPQYPSQPLSMGRPPSGSFVQGNGGSFLRKSPSGHSLTSQIEYQRQPHMGAPPLPSLPHGTYAPPRNTSVHAPQPRPMMPSTALGNGPVPSSYQGPSPPGSPVEEQPTGPITSTIVAQMKCKVFLQQHHAQWKSLGVAKLKLYRQQPTNMKQLVVEADNKDKSILISTIVLSDGVERVGKTGVAIELSDKGARTGIVYMIQLRNESAASGLFDQLLAGSDRAAVTSR